MRTSANGSKTSGSERGRARVRRTVASTHTGTVIRETMSAGMHTHAIEGGDSETRPQNVAVLWIIRAE